jgi:hypothetical protein
VTVTHTGAPPGSRRGSPHATSESVQAWLRSAHVLLPMSHLCERTCTHGAATSSFTYPACSPCRHSKRVQRARLVLVRSERRESEPVSGVLKAVMSDEAGISASASASKSAPIREDLVKTRYIAETLLPTRHGNFRLRGYKHSVSWLCGQRGKPSVSCCPPPDSLPDVLFLAAGRRHYFHRANSNNLWGSRRQK